MKLKNTNQKVDNYLKKTANPLTKEIQLVREIILSTSDKVKEEIKWSTPTFVYRGNIASFVMNSKQHVSLMFHYGAKIPDKYKLLEGEGKSVRTAKFYDIKDIAGKKKALQSIIKEWVKMQEKNTRNDS